MGKAGMINYRRRILSVLDFETVRKYYRERRRSVIMREAWSHFNTWLRSVDLTALKVEQPGVSLFFLEAAKYSRETGRVHPGIQFKE